MEQRIALVLLSAVLLLRILFACRYTVDSDEPQHLHVVWGWVHGLLQYRDLFDNHTPLFHMLFSPVLALLGESPETFYLCRFSMLPLYGAALWITHQIAFRLYGARAAIWTTVFTALFPSFFLLSVEFRTDVLWTLLWLWAVYILVDGQFTVSRGFYSGLLLGAAIGVSMKTTLLLAVLGFSALATLSVCCSLEDLPAVAGRAIGPTLALLVGLLVVPTCLFLYFFSCDALGPFIYGTIQHNMLPGLGRWEDGGLYKLVFLLACPTLWILARKLVFKSTENEETASNRVFVFFLAGFYIAAMESFWPLVTVQNYLPICPFIFINLTPLGIEVLVRSTRGKRQEAASTPSAAPFALVLSAFGAFEIFLLLLVGTPWHDGTRSQAALLEEVLSLTDPHDSVMDLKGETVFRHRPFYYALETITGERMRLGWIKDDVPERMIAAGTWVAGPDGEEYPPRTRAFLQENYLPVGILRVSGCMLTPSPGETGSFFFQVVIPGRYAIVCDAGAVQGALDAETYTGPRFLEAGTHVFRTSAPSTRMAVVWAQAHERGFSPFHPRSHLP